jgi:hypothetical protein
MRIRDLLEGSINQSHLEDLSYNLLIKIRNAKKNGSLSQARAEFESIINSIEELLIWTILAEDETAHIRAWLKSSKLALGLKNFNSD